MPNDRVQPAAGPGSLAEAPALPPGTTDRFASYRVRGERLTHHAVIGGSGPPLLLLAGWPQNWYAWRFLMLPLARHFTVIAADPRGVGLSDKPGGGYDSSSLAADMIDLMDALGHETFDMVGHDVGMWTGYALCADYPGRVGRLAVGEAIIPGLSPSPPLISDERGPSDLLWHFNFNRANGVNEALVAEREDIYFGYQFQTKAGSPDAIPPDVRAYYAALLKEPEALRASFDVYRALDVSIAQNRARATTPIDVPVFTFAGGRSCGGLVEAEMRSVASNVCSLVLKDCGHYPAEEAPEALLEALFAFFRLERSQGAALRVAA